MPPQINIGRDANDIDKFYRYKMDPIQTKIEGKGNGIKTVVVNLSTVAQQLNRPGSWVIKYFGFELGAQTNVDPPDDRWIINGAHDSARLQECLSGFIKKMVLCKGCTNPETAVQLLEDETINLDCKACGHLTTVNNINARLRNWVCKSSSSSKNSKKDKADRKAARRAKLAGEGKDDDGKDDEDSGDGAGDLPSPPENSSSNNINGVKDIYANSAAKDPYGNGGSDDELEMMKASTADLDDSAFTKEWSIDMSEAAVKARQAQLPSDLKQKLTIGDKEDDEDGEGGHTAYDELGAWIQEQAKELGGIDEVDSVEIYVQAKKLEIEAKHRTVIVLVQTIFDKSILAQIPKRVSLLKQIISSDRHERALLGGTERLVDKNPDLLQQIVKILQLYYHHDLLSEEAATKWGSKGSRKYVEASVNKKIRKAAEPFLTWLAEADEEESSDEE